jgi:Lrp/AsnC family leucine-responsive transcriptional regulator
MEIEETVLKLIKSRKKGILQNELWKKAEIDRRKCSRIVDKLEKEGKIVREKGKGEGPGFQIVTCQRYVRPMHRLRH